MDSMDSVCRKPPARAQPRIAALIGEENTQYFISKCCAKCHHFQCFLFFQDFILCQPDSAKKSGNYLAIVSDIKRNITNVL